VVGGSAARCAERLRLSGTIRRFYFRVRLRLTPIRWPQFPGTPRASPSNDYSTSPAKLQDTKKARGHEYSLWDGHSNVFLVVSEKAFMQRVNYIHPNPVRAGLVARAEDYRWSSARCWSRRPLEDEPLLMDLDKIIRRRAR
jgi:hypothetical protein